MDGKTDRTPSVFEWNLGKAFVFRSPEKRRRSNTTEVPTVPPTLPVFPELSVIGSQSISTQTDHEFRPTFYEAEKYFLEKRITELESNLELMKKHPFGFTLIAEDNVAVRRYTGLNLNIFRIISTLCSKMKFNYYTGNTNTVFIYNNIR